MNPRLIFPILAMTLCASTRAASPAVDAEISTATSKIVSTYMSSSYRETLLDDKTCASNLKAAFNQVSNGSTMADPIKIAAIRGTETLLKAWILAPVKEPGLKLAQCLTNLYGHTMVIMQGSGEPDSMIIGAIEPSSRIVAKWISSSNRETGLTYEQCLVNILGSMLVILRGSPTLGAVARTGACDATGDMVTGWLNTNVREKALTLEQCTRNLLGETLVRFVQSPKTEAVKAAAAKATALNIVDWLQVRTSPGSPTTEARMIEFLTIYLK